MLRVKITFEMNSLEILFLKLYCRNLEVEDGNDKNVVYSIKRGNVAFN